MNLIADAEVIPGLRETNGHLNGTDTHHAANRRIFQHQHIALIHFIELSAQRFSCTFDACGQRDVIDRQ